MIQCFGDDGDGDGDGVGDDEQCTKITSRSTLVDESNRETFNQLAIVRCTMKSHLALRNLLQHHERNNSSINNADRSYHHYRSQFQQ